MFIGASDDARFRAFDVRTGKTVWTTKLGASAHATPISYTGKSGRQYVAIVSAGGSYLGSPATASRLVVFGLSPRHAVPAAMLAASPIVAPPVSKPAPAPAAVRPVVAARDGEFAPGPERAFVQKACTACHVSVQVTSQRHTKEEWAAMVEKMIGFGAQVPDDQFDPIVGYLARNYPAAGK